MYILPFPEDPTPKLPPPYLLAMLNSAKRLRTQRGRRHAKAYIDRARELLAEKHAPAASG